MELLLAIISSFILEFYKWLAKRYGKKPSKNVIYLVLLGLWLSWTIVLKTQIINEEALKSFVSMVLYAIGIYEILIKNLKRL